jgi:mutator protein MutT
MKNHAAIILCENGKILFVQRSATKKTLPNIWAFPSGKVEKGESVEEAVVREAKEELGVVVLVKKKLATTELPELSARLHFMICSIRSGEPSIKAPEEIQSLRWLSFKEFFDEYGDDQIGHGLIYLRQHPEIWTTDFT